MTITERVFLAAASDDRDKIRAAAEAIDRHLTAGGSILHNGAGDETLYHLFEEIAGEDGRAHAQNLLEFPVIPDPAKPGQELEADAEACSRWSPVIDAAYYVGLMVGLRLGGAR